VRPRQNRLPNGTDLYNAMAGTNTGGKFGTATGPSQQSDLRTACYANGESNLYSGTAGTTPSADILCSVPAPMPPAAGVTRPTHATGNKYIYNDGDGSTRYDVDVPVQIHGFDPNFHFVGMTFNPEGFSDMKDKYFLLNGRSYPYTVGVPKSGKVNMGGTVVPVPATWTGGVPAATNPDATTNAISTTDSDGQQRPSQPIETLVILSHSGAGGAPVRAALRISDLDVAEYQTLASIGIPMQVVGYNAKLLRDQAGNNLYYTTNSITLGGGESLDAILDASLVQPGTYFIYTTNLDHLSNDAENFGGLMTEVVVTQ
jgi:hypothetical protein